MKFSSRNLVPILFLILCLYIVMSFSCAFASDVDNVTLNNEVNVDNNGSINVCDEITHENETVFGDFDELSNNIHNLSSGDVYNLNKDYCFKDKSLCNYSNPCIDIVVDNITINGNGHIIDGNHEALIFKVMGNNVKIFNLTFQNAEAYINSTTSHQIGELIPDETVLPKTCEYALGMSPICWLGDGGLISDCTFRGNAATNGGALSWYGKNGVINNTVFLDNIAWGVGGAIYIGGINNTVMNSLFINSTSRSSGEAIYLDCNRKNLILKNNTYEGNKLFIDGAISNIDVRFLCYSYKVQVADECINIVPLIYSAITNGGLSYLDNGLLYYSDYNDHDFTFHITKYFKDISFTKNFKFENISNNNNIFNNLICGDFENTLTLIKSINIYSNLRIDNDYLDAISTNTECFNTIFPYLGGCNQTQDDLNLIYSRLMSHSGNELPVTLGLNINFDGALTVNSNNIALNVNAGGFDIININGNGTKIYAQSKDYDENKWAIVGENKILSVNNLIIEGFNTGVENSQGNCIFNGVTFNNNRMDYWIYRDYGAAIISTGIVECNNCKFTNNYAKYGGAIFNQGLLNLEKCSFMGNKAYGKIGDNVCVGKGGVAIENNELSHGSEIINFCNKDAGQNLVVKFIDRLKESYLSKLIKRCKDSQENNIDIFSDIFSNYSDNLHVEGLKVISKIYQ